MEEKRILIENLELLENEIYQEDDANIELLAQDIAQNGLKHKVRVKYNGENEKYTVISGRARIKALLKLGICEIPCIIEDVPDGKELEATVRSNKLLI